MYAIKYLLEIKTLSKYILWGVVTTTAVGVFYSSELLYILLKPLTGSRTSVEFIYTHMSELFITYIKLALLVALYLNIPIMLLVGSLFFWSAGKQVQIITIFKYIGLYQIFYVGAFFLYYWWIIPTAFTFLSSFEVTGVYSKYTIALQAHVIQYTDFSITILVFLTLIFQVPPLLIYKAETSYLPYLEQYRYVAYLVLSFVTALITPPDLISLLIVLTPLIFCYESIVFSLHYKRLLKHIN